MPVQQLSVNMENAPGKLSTVSEILGKEGINIGAICIIDSSDTSVVRIICTEPEKALQVLTGKGYNVNMREVLAVQTPDHPGGLNAILKPLSQAGVNIDYLYSYLKRMKDDAIIIFGVKDIEKASGVMRENYIRILNEEIYDL